jgi:hypothetical protein
VKRSTFSGVRTRLVVMIYAGEKQIISHAGRASEVRILDSFAPGAHRESMPPRSTDVVRALVYH